MKRKIYAFALMLFMALSVLGTSPAMACGGGGMSDGDKGSVSDKE